MFNIDTTKILKAEMDRKAFLKNAGIAFAGIIGVTAVVKSLNGIATQNAPKNTTGLGYGASTYGGSSNQKLQ